MSYASIDNLQNVLREEIFSHTKDSKKAAGRALGTMIEIITYYLLKEWGLNDTISIERGLKEYGNPALSHNVEFTLHPILKSYKFELARNLPITTHKILKVFNIDDNYIVKNNTLLDISETLKTVCTIAEDNYTIVNASIKDIRADILTIEVHTQHQHPYAMFECKRVGVEEGNKKGPQTIEKAKQGAYVAQKASSLQKIRNDKGEIMGIIYDNSNPIIKPYHALLSQIIEGESKSLLNGFTLSVGIVSNHGNWFTNADQNKELKVLAQSYDWLLFLSDNGLAQFITELLLNPDKEYQPIRRAFIDSYKEGKKSNTFTKVRMNLSAHQALERYFHKNINKIESWFNIISPSEDNIQRLKENLYKLRDKRWEEIL
jgi:hypothetical protein